MVRNISLQDFRELRKSENSDVMVVNVLPREYFRKKHIPGSINVPVHDNPDFEEQIENLAGGKNRKIIVYCANTECTASPEAAEKLDEAGFTEVCDFEGGTAEWEEQEGEIARAA